MTELHAPEISTLSSPLPSANSSTPSLPSGRWIWFGLQSFNQEQWEQVCVQATAWNIQGLHPKVADGLNRWYDDAGLLMLRQVAERHGLRVIPYHYCYGPAFGGSQIGAEAQISAWAGQCFGAVIPDIEDQYMGQYADAESFGKQVRTLFQGLWMPTLYANPKDHPVPLLSLNPYMDAWLPQVYFAEWNGVAQSAIDYVYPQWTYFDQQALEQGQSGLKPVLPIISLENGISSAQVADFILKMHGYGYIGFWHYGTYGPYANAILNTPLPIPTAGYLPPTPPSATSASQKLMFNEDDHQLWTLYKAVVINEAAAIEQSWLRARYQKGWIFGPPLEDEHRVDRNGKTYIEQQFTAARASWEVETGLLTWWTSSGPVHI